MPITNQLSKSQLLQLAQLSGISLKDLHKQQPDLSKQLYAKLAGERQNAALSVFPNASQALRDHLQKLEFSIKEADTRSVRQVVLDSLSTLDKQPELVGEILAKSKELDNSNPWAEASFADTPIKDNPLFFRELQQAEVYKLTDLAKLPDAKAEKVVAQAHGIVGISDRLLDSLIADKTLNEGEARALGFTATLYHAANGNFALASAIKDATFTETPNDKVTQTSDLLWLTANDWLNLLTTAKVTPPENLAPPVYADYLSRRIRNVFPTDALLTRAIPRDIKQVETWLDGCKLLFERNARVFGLPFDQLKVDGLDDGTIKILSGQHHRLQRLSNLNPGLRLNEVFNSSDISAKQKMQEADRRTGLVAGVRKAHPHIEFLKLDYAPESAEPEKFFGPLNLSHEDRKLVINNFKAYQRVYSLTKDIADIERILIAGFPSALIIANTSQTGFQQMTGLNERIAKELHKKAGVLATKVGITAIGIEQAWGDAKAEYAFLNIEADSAKSYLMKFDGFADYFGSQDYCKCEHCRSILSPAAYFVDLMTFIKEHVSDRDPGDVPNYRIFDTEVKKRSPLYLKNRRPDLWSLPLTCQNTTELIPYLDIIIEILEQYIAKSLGVTNLNDQREIDRHVYGQALAHWDPARRDETPVRFFHQPNMLPLVRLNMYLSHFGRTRVSIARLMGASDDTIAAAALNLSYFEYHLIRIPMKLRNLRVLYGFNFNVEGQVVQLVSEDHDLVADLLEATGLNREQLGHAIGAKFVDPRPSGSVRIISAKRNLQSVQNDVERIENLTVDVLDRLHRFTRLWRQLSWSIAELDLVLKHLPPPPPTESDLDLARFGSLLALQERWHLSVEQLCALWSNIPQDDIEEGRRSFFDRLFNFQPFERKDGKWSPTVSNGTFIHPSFATGEGPAPVNNTLHRLLAALQIDDEKLVQLLKGLDLDGAAGFDLNITNLSLLYRHALLARLLQVTIPELFLLIALERGIKNVPPEREGDKRISDLARLNSFIEFYDWWKSTDWKLDDLAFVTNAPNPAGATKYPDKTVLANQILKELKESKAFQFADTVFVFTPTTVPAGSALTITEKLSSSIVALNSDTLEKIQPETADNTKPEYRIKSDFNLTTGTLNGPFEISAELPPAERSRLQEINRNMAAQALVILRERQPGKILVNKIAAHLGLAVEQIDELIVMSGVNIEIFDFTLNLYRNNPTDLAGLLEKLIKLSVVFQYKVLDADVLKFLNSRDAAGTESESRGRTLFGIADFNDIRTQSIRLLSGYRIFADFSKHESFALDEERPNPQEIRESLLILRDWSRLPSPSRETAIANETSRESIAKIGRILRADATLIKSLLRVIPYAGLAPEILLRLNRCVELAKYLGVDGETLRLIVAEDASGESDRGFVGREYERLARASEALLAAFRAKYADEKEFNEKLEPFEDRIRSRKRDALTDYIIHYTLERRDPRVEIKPLDPSTYRTIFRSLNDLYQYFLIDVQLEGCARTSKLVAAISSLQLYVHRCLMNLEQDALPDTDPRHIHVPSDAIPRDEWSWRKNYRVWEANRKVFLYPENYIEPELRDDKTPLFKELESNLLQQQINEQTVLDAYATYLTGFDELSKLTIAGSFHDVDEQGKTDILHLFGVTTSDPPVYYYRTIKNAIYGETEPDKGVVYHPWQKISVQIPVLKVAPVVYRSRLLLFWLEIVKMPQNIARNGSSYFTGYRHTPKIKYSTLRLDGTWAPPQEFDFSHQFVVDPLVENDEIGGTIRHIDSLRAILRKYEEDFDDDPIVRSTDGNNVIAVDIPEIEGKVRDFLRVESQGTEADRNEINRLQNLIRVAKNDLLTPRWGEDVHNEPVDTYSLGGFLWENLNIDILPGNILSINLPGISYVRGWIPDSYRKRIEPTHYRLNLFWAFELPSIQSTSLKIVGNLPTVNLGNLPTRIGTSYSATLSMLIDERRINVSVEKGKLSEATRQWYVLNLFTEQMCTINDANANALFINRGTRQGSSVDIFVDVSGDLLFFQKSAFPESRDYLLKRLNTTLADDFAQALSMGGINALLNTGYQLRLEEAALPITEPIRHIQHPTHLMDNPLRLDYTGAFGTCYREIFFHTPFLIANHLNSQQNFYAAQQWYHYIFDPTATPIRNDVEGIENRHWRYREFWNLRIPSLREILLNRTAIETYKKDPFNPHAIARLRFSAYQQCVLMKYIDNLLDWGDSLFAQFTMESVNEATMLYVMAADILGVRPREIGSCGSDNNSSRTYSDIEPSLRPGQPHDFLLELENWIKIPNPLGGQSFAGQWTISPQVLDQIRLVTPPQAQSTETEPVDAQRVSHPQDWNRTITSAVAVTSSGLVSQRDYDSPWLEGFERTSDFIRVLLRQGLAFCIPNNKDLLEYWQRVEDRLFKIRHCMDIEGRRRQLALFQPEIDPRLLVRARAAGLTIEEVLNITSGNLPPYRFSYIIEVAEQFAATLKEFGNALLSAAEKKDVEELNLLRTVHQQHLSKLETRVREWEIESANDTLESLERQEEAIQYRKDYYDQLISKGLSEWEEAQETLRYVSYGLRVTETVYQILATALGVLPDVGSPWAMLYGGKEVHRTAQAAGWAIKAAAEAADTASAAAGIIAGHERREDEWKHQKKLADLDLKQLEKQITAAKFRKDIADRSLAVHNKSLEQQEDVYDFLINRRSTKLGMYNFLVTTLQRVYRQAFNSAMAMAKLAEQAYQYERGDSQLPLLRMDYWNAENAGLLAGDQLLLDLRQLKRRFIETDYRKLEIHQTFSLMQIDPRELIKLRETGECDFKIPEFFFDTSYPGHYQRRIKAIRLTIPCVTGPYTNVSATLTLTRSQIRKEPKKDANSLVDVPLRHTVSIATSSAQNDAGVFELNFRDERYMPFEGAGAVSDWGLTLPKHFPQFDYQTISDVLIHISYTAEHDESFRRVVEGETQGPQAVIEDYLKNPTTPLVRAISLKQEFPMAFNQLIQSQLNHQIEFEVTPNHLPYLMKGMANRIQIRKLTLVLKTPDDQPLGGTQTNESGFTLQLNNGLLYSGNPPTPQTGQTLAELKRDIKLGNHWSVSLQGRVHFLGKHNLAVRAAGALAGVIQPNGITPAFDPAKMQDLIFIFEYGM